MPVDVAKENQMIVEMKRKKERKKELMGILVDGGVHV